MRLRVLMSHPPEILAQYFGEKPLAAMRDPLVELTERGLHAPKIAARDPRNELCVAPRPHIGGVGTARRFVGALDGGVERAGDRGRQGDGLCLAHLHPRKPRPVVECTGQRLDIRAELVHVVDLPGGNARGPELQAHIDRHGPKASH